ncbi:MAG: YggS family pyridoxal phosphate-dependent enzyme [Anaerolineales bacterium]
MNPPHSLQEEIQRNLHSVRERMAAAAERAGRVPSEVQLVAISKSQPLEKITAAYECGQRAFGENRVLEGIKKQDQLPEYEDIRWHMVGHIQSRKAEDAALHFDVIHSVDRQKIARRLDQFHAPLETRLPVYLELNVSGETSKGGWDFSQREDWDTMLKQVRPVFELDHLKVVGLMTMAPWVGEEDVLRNTFSTLRTVRDFVQEALDRPLDQLSMGMTDDFEIAIEEGATVVRIGRAIFGERQ